MHKIVASGVILGLRFFIVLLWGLNMFLCIELLERGLAQGEHPVCAA